MFENRVIVIHHAIRGFNRMDFEVGKQNGK
jgi:hypothetical protein